MKKLITWIADSARHFFRTTRLRTPILAVQFLTLTLYSSQLLAAFVTIDERRMDAIFSQESFGDNPIDIRFDPIVTINAGNLLEINSAVELETLFSLMPSESPSVNVFFVDLISYCGGSGIVVGCASLPGNDIAVRSLTTKNYSAQLISHELGHNLGLLHPPGCALTFNLMDCGLHGITTLSTEQVASIGGASNPIVQVDSSGLYIQMTPVLISAVPIPAAAWLFISAMGSLFGLKRMSQFPAKNNKSNY